MSWSFTSFARAGETYLQERQAKRGQGKEPRELQRCKVDEVTQKVIKGRFLSSKTISEVYKYDVFIVRVSRIFPVYASYYFIMPHLLSIISQTI